VLNGGGYISYGIGGKWNHATTLVFFDPAFDYGPFLDDPTIRTNGSSFSERTYKFDTGLGAASTLEFKNRYTISLFGEWGLKNTNTAIYPQNPSYPRSTISEKNHTYGLNIGYNF
jgi:hypothetical protein